jgi:hypothetical protein
MLWVFLSLLLAAAPGTAWAYIDPSAGSILLQLVLGGVAGLSVILKLYYRRLVLFFRRGAPEEPGREDAEPPASL